MPARRGHFAYASGHHGDLWLDLDTLFVSPRRLQPYVAELASQLTPHGLEVVCGPLTGGAFVAQAIAAELGIAFCWTSAGSYELPPAFAPVVARRRVAIVDDAINAGSAVTGTALALRSSGAHVTVVGSLLLLGDPPDLGAPVEHLAALPNALWTLADCPLCDCDTPLDPPPT